MQYKNLLKYLVWILKINLLHKNIKNIVNEIWIRAYKIIEITVFWPSAPLEPQVFRKIKLEVLIIKIVQSSNKSSNTFPKLEFL